LEIKGGDAYRKIDIRERLNDIQERLEIFSLATADKAVNQN